LEPEEKSILKSIIIAKPKSALQISTMLMKLSFLPRKKWAYIEAAKGKIGDRDRVCHGGEVHCLDVENVKACEHKPIE
jgi:hypothetical protein